MSFYPAELINKKIISSISEYEMIFIGENPHNNQYINDIIVELLIELAQKTDFKTYAMESLYCLHPFLETNSRSGIESKMINKKITEYNRNVDFADRITVTAVDLAHSIKHSTNIVKAFIQKHISDISKSNIKNEISELSNKIVEIDDVSMKKDIIKDLITTVESHRSEIKDITYAELSFYFELLSVSLEVNDLSNKSQDDLRNMWFIKTIERAIERNRSKMLCHVGAPHAYKTYISDDDYYTGKIPEAQYFNDGYFKDSVYSIQIRPFYWGRSCEVLKEIEDPIEKKAYEYLGNGKSVFVDLHEYNNQEVNIGIEKYCINDNYQFDGIIYVNDKEDA